MVPIGGRLIELLYHTIGHCLVTSNIQEFSLLIEPICGNVKGPIDGQLGRQPCCQLAVLKEMLCVCGEVGG